jgi:hypothetical protein
MSTATAVALADAIEQRVNVLIEVAFDRYDPDNAGIRHGRDTSREDLVEAIRIAVRFP